MFYTTFRIRLLFGLLIWVFTACDKGEQSGEADLAGSGGQLVPPVTVLSNVQAADPVEFETTRLMVELMRQLGLEVIHRALPWEQQADLVWYSRQKWQMTAWRMVGRPERLDPDEFVVNLFHSSTAETGYNFVGFRNADYDEAAMRQRTLIDREARRKVIYDAQSIVAEELPYLYVVHPKRAVAYRSDVLSEDTVCRIPLAWCLRFTVRRRSINTAGIPDLPESRRRQ